MLPSGTPEWMWKRLEVSPLNFVSNWRSFRYDFNRLKWLEGKIQLPFLFLFKHALKFTDPAASKQMTILHNEMKEEG
jgi:hypothetical protein